MLVIKLRRLVLPLLGFLVGELYHVAIDLKKVLISLYLRRLHRIVFSRRVLLLQVLDGLTVVTIVHSYAVGSMRCVLFVLVLLSSTRRCAQVVDDVMIVAVIVA